MVLPKAKGSDKQQTGSRDEQGFQQNMKSQELRVLRFGHETMPSPRDARPTLNLLRECLVVFFPNPYARVSTFHLMLS